MARNTSSLRRAMRAPRNTAALVAVVVVALALATAGCGRGDSPPDSASQPAPAMDMSELDLGARDAARLSKAVAIARAVRQDPDNLAGMLEQLGLTHDEMRVLFREIAADPELARAYELLLQRADP